MTVDEMTEKWVHKNDVQMIRDVYKNEMTITEVMENQEEYIEEMKNQLTKAKDLLYDAQVLIAQLDQLISAQPLAYKDIKKATVGTVTE